MPACEQADEYALQHRVLPGDHAFDLEEGLLEQLALLRHGRLTHGTLLARGFSESSRAAVKPG
jgi:hypothetical protein